MGCPVGYRRYGRETLRIAVTFARIRAGLGALSTQSAALVRHSPGQLGDWPATT